MRIAIVGTGYVGLVSGVCLAAKGHMVTCVDLNAEIVETLNKSVPHIYELGLEKLLSENVAKGRFKATTNLTDALSNAQGVIVAVGTPSENGIIDLSYVRAVAAQIGTFLKTVDTFIPVIIKSTVIPGTTDTVVLHELEAASGKKLGSFGLGMNPEFLREGNAVSDFMEPDRIVLGHEDPQTLEFLENLYAPWTCDKLAVNTRTAELIKYSNNCLLAVQISAVNELANLASTLGGIDILDVMKGVHLDKRLNPLVGGKRVNPEILTYLIPGCGFGGSCFPKDVQALRSQGENLGLSMEMLNAVLDINDHQPSEVISILERELGDLRGVPCLVLGLAFKPDTDDVRESASLHIVADLLEKGAKVTAHDPIATENFKKFLGLQASDVRFVTNWKQEVASASVVVIATKWNEYHALSDLDLKSKAVFDARRLIDPQEVKGARYLSIGRRV